MNKTKKAAAVGVPVALLLTVIGGMSLDFDFSTTNIGQIGDRIINNYLAEQDIDIEQFKQQCDDGLHIDTQVQLICDVVT